MPLEQKMKPRSSWHVVFTWHVFKHFQTKMLDDKTCGGLAASTCDTRDAALNRHQHRNDHFATLRSIHGAPANHSPERRRVVSIRWVGDDARFVKRQGTTSPAFPDLEYEDGAPFDAPIFPVIHPPT